VSREAFYITTPIYYPDSRLHVGHSYTTVAADAIARFQRARGRDVLFLTGTDENAPKIQRSAAEKGKGPREFVDGIVEGVRELWKALHISHDDFIRTTEPRHRAVVQQAFERIRERGDIYKSTYSGWYCLPCETFWLERQIDDGRCPECGAKVEMVEEESYFFRLSRYSDRLLRHIEDHPEFIQPESRKNEMVSFIQSGLEDLCVSRPNAGWGIPIASDPKHVVYVWFDALLNYVSAAGYGVDEEKFRRYWPANVHLMGKEIVRFHSVIWPAILMSLGLDLPDRVFGHGWLVLEGAKMSKSKGNVVDPLVLVNKYGVDAVRYYLLREIPFGADGHYTEEALVSRTNTDLANDLGNLLHRTCSMIHRFAGGRVPEPGPEEDADQAIRELVASTARRAARHMEELDPSQALSAIWELVGACNMYVDRQAPWGLARDGRRERLGRVLYTLAEALGCCAVQLAPFLVEAPRLIWRQLGIDGDPAGASWESAASWGAVRAGTPIGDPRPIFPRLDPAEVLGANRAGDPSGVGPDVDDAKGEAGAVARQQVSISEFQKLDLRTATVVEAVPVEGTDRLLRLVVDDGRGRRQVVAGIAEQYDAPDLVGRTVVLVANLEPAVIRGVESQGMVLAAEGGGVLSLLTTDRDVAAGARVL